MSLLSKSTAQLEPELLEHRFMLSSVQVIAAGTTGQEWIAFQVNGQTIRNFSDLGTGADSGQFVSRSFTTGNTISADQVRVRFMNDRFTSNGDDRNVRIDAIVIDGVRYETENSSVFSTGTWKPEDGVAPGFRNSEFLHANGYFQLPIRMSLGQHESKSEHSAMKAAKLSG